MRRLPRIFLIVLLVAAAAALGYGVSRWSRQPDSSVALQAPAGSALESRQPTIPAELPVFNLQDSNNQLRSSTEWAGKSMILNFWATWCPPCLREIPVLNALHARKGPENFQVVGVAVDRREDVLAYMEKTPIQYPVLIGEQEALDVAEKLGVPSLGLPFTVFSDAQGRIVTLKLGELDAHKADAILELVSLVNDGSLTLQQARDRLAATTPHKHSDDEAE